MLIYCRLYKRMTYLSDVIEQTHDRTITKKNSANSPTGTRVARVQRQRVQQRTAGTTLITRAPLVVEDYAKHGLINTLVFQQRERGKPSTLVTVPRAHEPMSSLANSFRLFPCLEAPVAA